MMIGCRLIVVASEFSVCHGDWHDVRASNTTVCSQDDNTFEWSQAEPRPTRRSLVGVWWADKWEVIKAILARQPDGSERVAWSVCAVL